MPYTKEGGSMFKMVEDHEKRIVNLERADEEQAESIRMHDESIETLKLEFKTINMSFLDLKNTVLQGNSDTQSVMREQSTQQWKMIEALMGNKEKGEERKHELKKSRSEKFWEVSGKVAVALVGSGSILIGILELLSK